MLQNYVLGFLFDATASRVLLIRKQRPRWQAGKLNGIGGKVEPGETACEALVREVREEASLDTAAQDWRYFGVLEGVDFRVYCFETRCLRVTDAIALTDEPLELHAIDLPLIAREGQGNLAALVLHALDADLPFIRMSYREAAQSEASDIRPDVPLGTS